MEVPGWLITTFSIFLITQAGGLIWFLSRINTELKTINEALKTGRVRFDAQELIIENHAERLAATEARCQERHGK